MSREAVSWALRDPRVQGHVHGPARAVLIVLAEHANAQGEAWPSVETIVAECGFARGTVAAALAKLEEAGFVTSDGYRHRSRLRRLGPATSPGAGTVDPEAGHAHPSGSRNGHPAATLPRPSHDLPSTRPGAGNEPEPEPEPVEEGDPPPPLRIKEHREDDPFAELAPDALRFAQGVRELVLPGRRPNRELLCDVADLAEYVVRHGLRDPRAFVTAAKDTRPDAMLRNAHAILPEARRLEAAAA